MERGRRRGQGLGLPLLSILMMIISSLSSSILLNLINEQSKTVSAFHASSMCVQLGQANANAWYVNKHTDPITGILSPRNEHTFYFRHGYWTIGTRKFDTKFSFLDYAFGNIPDDDADRDFTGFDPDKEYPKRRRRRAILESWDALASDNVTNDILSRSQNKAAPVPPPPPTPPSLVIADPVTGGCPYTWIGWFHRKNILDWCPEDDHVEIRTYAVKEVVPGEPDRVLNGWLYFEIELKDTTPGDQILAIYVQVRDEFFNAIGEFVSDPNELCPNRPGKDFAQPTPYQVLPCSAVEFREAKVSNALFMARKQALKDPTKVKPEHLPPDQQMKYGIRFTWRLSEYWCNRHLRFRPEAVIFTKKMAFINIRYGKPYILRKAANYWIKHKWYGAADIKRENTKLSCDEPAISYQTGEILKSPKNVSIQAAPWFDKSVLSIYEDDYMHPEQWIHQGPWQLKSCQFDPRSTFAYPGDYKDKPFPVTVKDTVPTFSGRCTHHYRKDPNHNALQGCNLNASADEFQDLLNQYPNIQNYTTFVKVLTTNRSKLCTVPCHPPTIQNLSQILGYNDTSNEGKFIEILVYHKDELVKRKREQFIVGRKYHATLCIYWTMFLMPVGIFIARYLKETCMSATCTGAHLWFWVHVSASVMSIFISIGSLTSLLQTLDNWGRSTQAYGEAHRIIGYFSIVLFGLMVLLGGFRGLKVKMRFAMMTAHSVLGFIIYYSNILAMILSAYIPASPSMGDYCAEDGTPTEAGDVITVIGVWIGMDAVLHATMNILQCRYDREQGIHRPWWCPILPILLSNSEEDMVGSLLRKMTMGAYAGAAFIMATTAVGRVNTHIPENEACLDLLGERDCKKEWGCSQAAMAYVAYMKEQMGMNMSHSY